MLKIEPIRAFTDNYIWWLQEQPDVAVVVDPGEATPVEQALEARGQRLAAVLLTHHHQDHAGGVERLRQVFPGLVVYGPRDARLPQVDVVVEEGERITPPGLETPFEVWEVPGHTATHIAYLGAGALFCGDTLFAAGCGRVFDGTFEQLAQSLLRIATLPPQTACYCAHEYTLENLGFAEWVEPQSAALKARHAEAQRCRDADRPTVPSSLELELATNPFMRLSAPEVVAAAAHKAGHAPTSPVEVFTVLRRWKDTEYD